jgi:type VI secretion system secreted protein VgrG
MKKNGDITIQGKNIEIIGSGKIDMKASGNMTLKGSQIKEN